METAEGNKLIAEFMGAEMVAPIGHTMRAVKFPKETHGLWVHAADDLRYHTSWDWLMPVVEKIRSLRDTTLTDKTNGLAYSTISISFEANGHALGGDKNKYRASLLGTLVYQRMINSFQHTFDKVEVPHITKQGENPIETLYEIIIQFITWYNTKL